MIFVSETAPFPGADSGGNGRGSLNWSISSHLVKFSMGMNSSSIGHAQIYAPTTFRPQWEELETVAPISPRNQKEAEGPSAMVVRSFL